MENDEVLKQMILTFRLPDLISLLTFAGRNKAGRKQELQKRAIDLLNLHSPPVTFKIKQLYAGLGIQSKKSDEAEPLEADYADKMQPHNNRGYPSNPSNVYVPPHPANRSAAQMYAYQQQQQHHLQQAQQQQVQQQQQYPVGPSKPLNMAAQYPVHPEVKLKRLPFYDEVVELLKPSSLGSQRQQDGTFTFFLTPGQADMIATSRNATLGNRYEFTNQVILRFCPLETASEQEDCFPPLLTVKVNQKVVPLPNPIQATKPGLEAKRPPRPVNITPLVKISPTATNVIQCTWSTDYSRGYVMVVVLVRKRTSDDLLHRLKAKGVRSADYTRGMIIDKLKEDGEIATTSLRVTLLCPLGKMRMTTPCRASTCNHFQCFDALTYLQMNEKKSSWICPVCNKQAVYDKLVIDGYFQEVLLSKSLSSDCTDMELHSDGSWQSVVNCKKELVDKIETPKKSEPVKMENSDNGVDGDDVAIVTLSDSDDEDAPLKPKKTNSNVVADNSPSYQEGQKTATPSSPRPQSPSLIILDDSPQGSPVDQSMPQFNANGRAFFGTYPSMPSAADVTNNRYPY